MRCNSCTNKPISCRPVIYHHPYRRTINANRLPYRYAKISHTIWQLCQIYLVTRDRRRPATRCTSLRRSSKLAAVQIYSFSCAYCTYRCVRFSTIRYRRVEVYVKVQNYVKQLWKIFALIGPKIWNAPNFPKTARANCVLAKIIAMKMIRRPRRMHFQRPKWLTVIHDDEIMRHIMRVATVPLVWQHEIFALFAHCNWKRQPIWDTHWKLADR